MARGQRVLVASYTHAAVDHLMLKLRDAGLDEAVMVRLGSKRSVDERLHRYLVDQSSCDNMNTLHNRITKARVVGCTVLSAARHVLLECIDFDWCIMDEAGQISQPAAIGPLMQVDKFLLVGDDYQLPPLVVSTEAKAMVQNFSFVFCSSLTFRFVFVSGYGCKLIQTVGGSTSTCCNQFKSSIPHEF